MEFYKYQGTGNDFVMIDDRKQAFPAGDREYIAGLCDRRFGIGADGLILLRLADDGKPLMLYYNSDGRESSMCGNGGRCFAAFCQFLGLAKGKLEFDAIDGLHPAELQGEDVKLRMKDVDRVEVRNTDTFVLNTGSPHYVVFTHIGLRDLDMVEEARSIRYNHEFSQEGINVNFVNRLSDSSFRIRTYERGVEGETLSCGTGITASALAFAMHEKLPAGRHRIWVESEGGTLTVSFEYKSDGRFTHIWLQGNAVQVYSGSIKVPVRKI